MNKWIITVIITSIIVLAIFAVTSYTNAQQPVKTTSCSGCDGKCTSESSCGKTGCSAKETGTCNCNKE